MIYFTSYSGFGGILFITNDLDIFSDFDFALLDGTSDNSTSSGNSESGVDGHHEFFINGSFWDGDGVVHDLQQF